ncbi:MAG: alpha/beta hydrolase [Proteobacteria bacterium]|nr:MAG: alpha/beta hydrolase [Pseudomonadota bacterium]
MKKLSLIIALLLTSSTFIACGGGSSKAQTTNTDKKEVQETKRKFGIFKVLGDNRTIEMDGDIKRKTPDNFDRLLQAFPNIDTINIVNCPGSLDDESNFKLSKKVHERDIKIHLMDNGEIASGGVDFFLAGVKRSKGENTKIGVHAWSGDGERATDFPRGHANHLPYIKYYVSIGFSKKWAEDFYYFTIYSAPAKGIHWMSEEEIEKYGLITK